MTALCYRFKISSLFLIEILELPVLRGSHSTEYWYDADPGDCDWYIAGLFSNPDTFTKNPVRQGLELKLDLSGVGLIQLMSFFQGDMRRPGL
ncbi:unnamed protein product [Calypogeia fissa]